jgi:single-strand DNA-binding protein
MSRDLNKVMVIGRLGRDPEMRFTPSGRPVTTFSVASGRSWTTSDGQKRSETEWFNIVAWGGLAEVCNQYLEKGMRVYIEGRLQTRRWEDSNGVKKSSTEVVASEMIMLSQRTRRSHEGEDFEYDEDYGNESGNDIEEDFPFM